MKTADHYDIVVLVSNDLTNDRRMHRTCQTLRDAGATVLLIGRKLRGSISLQEKAYDQLRLTCRYNTGPAFYAELIWRMSTCLKSISYNKLVCVDFDTLGVLRLVDTSDFEVYFDAHELFTEVPELAHKPIKKWIWRRLATSVAGKINHCYTVSSDIADILHTDYGLKAEVIHNVPLQGLRNKSVSTKPFTGDLLTLVYLGVLNPGRGIEEAIRAVLVDPILRLHIIGDGPERERLIAMAAECERIIWHGRLASQDFELILQSSHIGLNLLDTNSHSYYLSLANKFFDYAHAGLPVITMDTPTYKRYVRQYDCGYLLPELSATALEELLFTIIADSASLDIKRHGALKMASDYNWQIESQKLLKIYDLS